MNPVSPPSTRISGLVAMAVVSAVLALGAWYAAGRLLNEAKDDLPVLSVAAGFRMQDQRGRKEPMMHSARFVLVDGEGRVRGTYDSQDAEKIARLEKDAKALAKKG